MSMTLLTPQRNESTETGVYKRGEFLNKTSSDLYSIVCLFLYTHTYSPSILPRGSRGPFLMTPDNKTNYSFLSVLKLLITLTSLLMKSRISKLHCFPIF